MLKSARKDINDTFWLYLHDKALLIFGVKYGR